MIAISAVCSCRRAIARLTRVPRNVFVAIASPISTDSEISVRATIPDALLTSHQITCSGGEPVIAQARSAGPES
jgi:hypothetical protein